MKYNIFQWVKFLAIVVICLSLTNCDNENEDNNEVKNPEDNTTDVAVTGKVSDVGAMYAQLDGVINLDVISVSYTSIEIGVEVSETETFESSHHFPATNVVGRTFSVKANGLKPETKHFYRTYVSISTLSFDYLGKTGSFTTTAISSEIAQTGKADTIGATYVWISGKADLSEILLADATAEVGIEIDSTTDFSTAQQIWAKNVNTNGEFSVIVTDLKPETEYFFRTYICVSNLFYVGHTLSFFTDKNKTIGFTNGHEWIDLGLPSGLKWAAYNIGAEKPEDFGAYFAWGETKTKENYNFYTYKYCYDENLTKYNNKESYGTIDNKNVLDSSDDAATVIFGYGWRMPTHTEWKELQLKCIWEWCTLNEVDGYKVISSQNDNFIFLPATGHYSNYDLKNAGTEGTYWSSTLFDGDAWVAHAMEFVSTDLLTSSGYAYRSEGCPVRAVCP